MIGRGALVAVRLADVFLRKHGHSRKQGPLPVSAKGDFQPWLTYPMIEFLASLDLSGKSVLEFGSGGSTLYWAKHAKDVVSVEMDAAWADRLASLAPANVRIIHEPDGGKYPDAPKTLRKNFDIILIDGAERLLPPTQRKSDRDAVQWLRSAECLSLYIDGVFRSGL
jgi:predicted O-methyltransferase YrrM